MRISQRIILLVGVLLCSTHICSSRGEEMKIKMLFDKKEVVVRMEDNTATKQFLEMLPAEFEFKDFAGQEKISYFPKAVNLDDAPHGMVANRGKMFIYAPWGNFGFYYKDVGTSIDKSLIPMGTIESGIEYLFEQKNDFSAFIMVDK